MDSHHLNSSKQNRRRTMKKLYTIMAIVLLASMVLTACGGATATAMPAPATSAPAVTQPPAATAVMPAATATTAAAATAPDCTQANVFCVGDVTDVGHVDDKSFNQSTWEGVQKAKADGSADWVQYIETSDAKDYAKNISTFADAGYKVIVTTGFNLTEPTYAAAKQYPKVMFIGVDQSLAKDATHPDWPLPNLVGLVYNEDQSGFLVGALAAMMSKAHNIGGVFGTDAVPPVWRYGEGYRAGAAYEDKKNGTKTTVTNVYHNDVGFDKTFLDPPWGATTAQSMIDKGADVIFGGGGSTGNGAVDKAAADKVLAIGVDTDQYYTLPEADAYLLTSAMKPIPGPLDALIGLAKSGKFPATGVYVGSAGYAPYHDLASQVPANVDAEMQALLKGLADGSILTGVAPVKPAQ
jgi:basic membrane protein A